ncbi:MAG: response regulator [Thermoleophilia bacterium]|nr:response regulator [Thermoleophilia bacterium]
MNDKKNNNILVVDDEATIREILQRTLESEGYQCGTAADASEAITIIDSSEVDLVLSDIMMPGKSGVELLRDIRKKSPDTAVIMVTAVADTQTAINAMKQGASDYVTKPFNLVEVMLSVDRALEKKSLILANREYRLKLEEKVQQQTEEIRLTFLGAVKALAEALEAKDPYTNGHSIRVTELAVTLARESGLSTDEQEQIRLAGLVHDIGKIGVPEEILHKPDRLTEQEFDFIKEHPGIGERILRPIISDPVVLAIVRHHHEQFAGGGYPEGLAGEDIPMGSRLMGVADAYDAMTSSRPYRNAMHPDKAKSQLLANRGSQFDPEVVDLFMSLDDKKMPFCPISAAPGRKPG